jgi:hypothetical protein
MIRELFVELSNIESKGKGKKKKKCKKEFLRTIGKHEKTSQRISWKFKTFCISWIYTKISPFQNEMTTLESE